MRWSDELYKKLSKEHQTRKSGKKTTSYEPKKNKYNAIRTASGFPSKLEEAVYGELLYLQKAGLLRDVKRYPSVKLIGKLVWKCDFTAFDIKLNCQVWIEAKGYDTERYKTILQVWSGCGPGLLRIYKGDGRRVWIEKEIKGHD